LSKSTHDSVGEGIEPRPTARLGLLEPFERLVARTERQNHNLAALVRGDFHGLSLFRFPVHDEEISAALPFILDAVHQLSHEMNSQTAGSSFIDGSSNVDIRRREGVKRTSIVLDFGNNRPRPSLEANANFMLPVVRITVRNDVGENFFEGETEIVHNLRGQNVPPAEFR
jgi:hypothetical protein